MIDGFERKIEYLRVSITDRCNLRCRYCMPAEGIKKQTHANILSIEEISEIVEACVSLGVHKVRVTGGEPLVRKGVTELCRNISSIPGIDELAITTNGLLLDEMAHELKSAGVNRVNISLDTLNAEKYSYITRGGELSKALAGIDAAYREELTPIKINVVLMGGFNDDEIPQLCELTRDRAIEVRFIELMPIGSASELDPKSFIGCNQVLESVPELSPCGSSGVAKLYSLKNAKGRVGLITPVSHDFCSRCNRIRLTSDGKIKPCLHSSTEISIRGLHGDELIEALQRSIMLKPERHEELKPGIATAGGRTMNRIGG